MKNIMKNIAMLGTLVVWVWVYNSYFGHNWLPQSEGEVLADGLTTIAIILMIAHYKW